MKKVIGIILIIVISLVILSGCTNNSVEANNGKYIIEDIEDNIYVYSNIQIIYDTRTKVQYLIIKDNSVSGFYNCAIQVLLDAEGKPLLYEGE